MADLEIVKGEAVPPKEKNFIQNHAENIMNQRNRGETDGSSGQSKL